MQKSMQFRSRLLGWTELADCARLREDRSQRVRGVQRTTEQLDELAIRKKRCARTFTDADVETVLQSMSVDEQRALFAMNHNDQEQFLLLRLEFLKAAAAHTVTPAIGSRSGRSTKPPGASSRKRELQFLRRHNAHGRSTPREKPRDMKDHDGALDLTNFGLNTPMSRADRFRHRSFYVDQQGSYRVLRDVYSAYGESVFRDISSRTLYFSRVEKNRLAHAQNGNTARQTTPHELYATASCNTMSHSEERRQGSGTYLSNRTRNRLAHTVHGNTARRMAPEELYDSLVCVPVQPHRCKGRVYTLSQCSRSPKEGSDFCAQHSKTLQHGRFDNPVPAKLRDEFLRSGYKCLQPKQFQWYSRRRMWHFAEERGKNSVDELDDQ